MTRTLVDSSAFTDEQKRIGRLLGINTFDSSKDMDQITSAVSAAQALGIQAIDSQNDIRQIREYNNRPTEETTPTPTPAPEPTTEPTTTTTEPTTTTTEPETNPLYDDLIKRFSELSTRFNEQTTALDTLKTDALTRETEFKNQLDAMIQQQGEAQQRFQQQAADQQAAFERAQRVSASNMARGGQQTDYRLGSAGAVRGGTAGFRRRSKPVMPTIGAAGFSTPTASNNSAKTLNV